MWAGGSRKAKVETSFLGNRIHFSPLQWIPSEVASLHYPSGWNVGRSSTA